MNRKIRILFVDDDISLGQIVTLAVEAAGYEVHYQTSLAGITGIVKEWDPQLIVLDVEVGGRSGFEVAPELQHLFPSIPLLFVSSHTDIESVSKGLNAGGVTYLKKPFEIDELLAYIRRYACPQPMDSGISFGNFKLMTDTHQLFCEGSFFKKLTLLEYKLLELLLSRKGEIVDRDSIILELWGGEYSSTVTQSLNNLVSHLRKYFLEGESVRLKTYPKIGYSLIIYD